MCDVSPFVLSCFAAIILLLFPRCWFFMHCFFVSGVFSFCLLLCAPSVVVSGLFCSGLCFLGAFSGGSICLFSSVGAGFVAFCFALFRSNAIPHGEAHNIRL